jgi:CheY-like chemotaxis protein
MRVLIVDDNRSVGKMIGDFLAEEGCSVRLAGTGREALAALEGGERADVVVVDAGLPDMEGCEVIRRAMRAWPGLRFVVHTGEPDYRLPGDLLDAGLDGRNVLAKPVTDLYDVLETLRLVMHEDPARHG